VGPVFGEPVIEQYKPPAGGEVIYRTIFPTLIGVERKPILMSMQIKPPQGTGAVNTPQCNPNAEAVPLWKYPMKAPSWSSPRRIVYTVAPSPTPPPPGLATTTDGGTVDAILWGSDDTILYCVEVDSTAGDGSLKGPCPGWPYLGSYGNLYGRIRSAVSFAPPTGSSLPAGSKVYATSHDGYLHCIDLAEPNKKSERLKLKGHTWSEPVVEVDSKGDIIVFVSDSAGYLHAVDGKTCGSITSLLVNDMADLYDDSVSAVVISIAVLVPCFVIVGVVLYFVRKKLLLQMEQEELVAKDRQEEADERESQALIRESSSSVAGTGKQRAHEAFSRPNGVDEDRPENPIGGLASAFNGATAGTEGQRTRAAPPAPGQRRAPPPKPQTNAASRMEF